MTTETQASVLRAVVDSSDVRKGVDEILQQLNKLNTKTVESKKSFDGLGDAAGRLKGGLGTLAAQMGAIVGTGALFAKMVEEAGGAEVAMLRLNALLKAQGNQAVMTAAQVKRLAGELASVSVFDDDEIIAGTTALLRFGNMSDEVVKRTASLAVNLAAATDRFGNFQTAAQVLGRALQNPGEGMRQLAMAGFGLSKATEDAAQKLVDQGKKLEAQALVLSALEKKTGDVAKAYRETLSGSLAAASRAFGEFAQAAGESSTFNNSLKDLANTIARVVDPATSQAAARVATALGTAFGAAVKAVDLFIQAIESLINHMDEVIAILAGAAFAAAMTAAIGLFTTLGGAAAILNGAMLLAVGRMALVRGAMIALNAVMAINPFVAVGAAVVMLGTYLYQNRNQLTSYGDTVVTIGDKIKIALIGAFEKATEVMMNWLLQFKANLEMALSYAAAAVVPGGKSGEDAAREYIYNLDNRSRMLVTGNMSVTDTPDADAAQKQRIAEAGERVARMKREAELQAELQAELEGRNRATGESYDELSDAAQKFAEQFAEMTRQLKGGISDQQKLYDASLQSSAAYARMSREVDILSKVRGLDKQATAAQRAEYEKMLRTLDALTAKTEFQNSINDRADSLERIKLEQTLVYATTEERNKQLAIYDAIKNAQQSGLDLSTEQLEVLRQSVSAEEDAKAQLDRMNEARDAFINPFKEGIKAIEDGFTSAIEGTEFKLSNLADSMVSMFRSAAAQVAKALIFQPIMSGVLNGISPTIAQAAGYSQGGVGSGGIMNSASNIFSIGKSLFTGGAGGYSAVNGFGASLGFGNLYTPGVGWSSGFTSASLGSVLGAGGIGFGVGSLLGSFGANKAVSSIGGAASGALAGFMMGGPVGALVGGIGGVLGGLLGGKAKPSNAWATANVDFTKGVGTYTHPNKGNSAENMKIMQQNMDAVISFIQGFNQLGVGTATGSATGELGTRDTGYVNVTGQLGSKRLSIAKGDYAGYAAQSAKTLLELTSINNADVKTAMGKVDFKDLTKALEDLSYAAGFADNVKQYRDGLSDEITLKKAGAEEAKNITTQLTQFRDTAARLGLNTAAANEATRKFVDTMIAGGELNKPLTDVEQAVVKLKAQWDNMIPALTAVGYSTAEATSKIQEGYQNNLAVLRNQFTQSIQDQIMQIQDPTGYAMKQLDADFETLRKNAVAVGASLVDIETLYGLKRQQIVEAGLKQTVSNLQDWLLKQSLGDNSSLSPVQKLQEAQSQFNTILTAARGGDASATGKLTGAADALLSQARGYYGSSVDFSMIESSVRSSISSILHDAGVPGFARGTLFAPRGLAMVGERGPEVVSMGGGESVITATRTASLIAEGNTSLSSEIRRGNESNESLLAELVKSNRENAKQIASLTAKLDRILSGSQVSGRRATGAM